MSQLIKNNNWAPEGSSIKEKFGDIASTGFVQIPAVLLFNQKKLGLNNTDLLVLFNIMIHWWKIDKPAYPTTETLSKRMGMNKRTVQRAIKNLEKAKLLKSIPKAVKTSNPYARPREFDLAIMKETLNQPQFIRSFKG